MSGMQPFSIALPPPDVFGHSAEHAQRPHTPLPCDRGDFMHRGGLALKRAREDDAESISSCDGAGRDDEQWDLEQLDVLHSILHNPLRPLSSAYPPCTLPPSQALDELTDQITGASACEWRHSWTSTRGKLFELALKESKGLRLAPAGDAAQWVRPPIKRVGSMDFLEHAQDDDRGRAFRLSTSLQNTATRDPPSFEPPSMLLSAPAMTITPASPVSAAPKASTTSRRSRPSRAAYTRRPSLLQRGTSFTASDLARDDDTAAAPVPSPRLTRSQSSLFLSHALNPPNSLTKAFLAPHEPSTADPAELCRPILLAPDDTRKKRRLSPGLPGTAPAFHMPVGGLSSPFEEKRSLEF